MSFPSIDNTTLTALTPNLDIGDVADPALRLAYFQYLNTYLASVISLLNATTAGASGAHNIGSASISGVTGSTVYAQLGDLKNQINQAALGQIPDGSLTDVKLSDSAGQIKARFTAHEAESASETVKGHVELATAAETTAGTDNTRAVHPAGLKVELDKKLNLSGGTLSGAVSHGRNNVNQPQIKDYSETLVTNAAATGAVDLNIANGNVFDVTLTGNTTFTFSNPAPNGQACSFTLILRQGGTSRTVTWPASVKWSNDVIPDVSDINKTSILTFLTVNGGTRWYGFLAANKLVT